MNTFTFGKYKGRKVTDVIKTDRKYVSWCLNNVSFFSLNEEQEKLLQEERNNQHHTYSGYGGSWDDEIYEALDAGFFC